MAKYCSECGTLIRPKLITYDYKTKYILQDYCNKCGKPINQITLEYVSQELTPITLCGSLEEYVDILSDELNVSFLKEKISIKYEWRIIFDNASKDSHSYNFRDLDYKIALPYSLSDRVAHKLNEHFIKLMHLPKATSHTIMRWPFDNSIEMSIYTVDQIKPYIKITFVAKTINAMKIVYFKKIEREEEE